MTNALDGYWSAALSAASLSPTRDSDEVLADLKRRLDEPHRRYHTAQHVLEACQTFDLLRCGAEDIRLAEGYMALLFHDAIYLPGRTDNELLSAELAARCLKTVGMKHESVDLIERIILATKDHVSSSDNETLNACLDADMAILGAPSERYAEYVGDLRTEYAAFEDEAWTSGRAEFLTTTLAGDIFLTQKGRDLYLHQARVNMRNELDLLVRE